MKIDNNLLLYHFSALPSNILIQLVILISLFDILTGMAVGFKSKTLDSTKGLNGVVKHMCVVILILLTYPYMQLLEVDFYANIFVGFYIVSYLLSILENLTRLDVPVPTFIKQYLIKARNYLDYEKDTDVK